MCCSEKKRSCQHRKPIRCSSSLIPVDTANKMIASYLNGIGYTHNDTTLRSMSIDADLLKDYLNTSVGQPEVKYIKIMFAHTLDYINSGKEGVDAGMLSGALTLIMTGYDVDGNYVTGENAIINKAIPCPNNCPPGIAADPFIPISPVRK